jgi:UDP-N-acetylmuramyl pentapeptide phosphotransferase/UDP-N-acetylglucosamine-1-phosphate transferase
MLTFLIFFLLLFAAQLAYLQLARRYGIVDNPNARSSHSQQTIRGGGLVFVLAVILSWIAGYLSMWVSLAVVLVGAVSLADDMRGLPQWPRLAAHLIASLALVLEWQQQASFSLGWIPLILFLVIGWINLFNFMDGINGITVAYALVALGTFYWVPELQDDRDWILLVGLSCLVFAWFNFRKKARVFAGDVGSVSMALILGYLMVKIILLTGNPWYLFFFSLYGVDAVLTLLIRLRRKENLFQPHRSHLYQFLANEKKLPHRLVSLSYAGLQLGINWLWMEGIGLDTFSWLPGLVFTAGLVGVYLLVRFWATPTEPLQQASKR